MNEYEEFFCPYCMQWLGVEGIVHEAAHHHDNEDYDRVWPTKYRTVRVLSGGWGPTGKKEYDERTAKVIIEMDDDYGMERLPRRREKGGDE